MHEPLLAQAALPAPTVVCGMLLRPFSLGHQLFLIREQNAILFNSAHSPASLARTRAHANFPALCGAVLICAQSWDQAKRMNNEWFIGFKLWLWKRRLRHANFFTELANFHRYIESGALEFPISEIARPDRGAVPRSPGTPFLLRLHAWLMAHLRITESEAWDYPLGLAKMRWAAHWEQEAGLDIYNNHDAEFDKFVAEQEAKRKPKRGRDVVPNVPDLSAARVAPPKAEPGTLGTASLPANPS